MEMMPSSLHALRVFVARHIGLVPLAALVMMLVFLLFLPQRSGGTAAAAGRGGDDAGGLWVDGLAWRPDLPHHRRDARDPHWWISGYQRHLSVQPATCTCCGEQPGVRIT